MRFPRQFPCARTEKVTCAACASEFLRAKPSVWQLRRHVLPSSEQQNHSPRKISLSKLFGLRDSIARSIFGGFSLAQSSAICSATASLAMKIRSARCCASTSHTQPLEIQLPSINSRRLARIAIFSAPKFCAKCKTRRSFSRQFPRVPRFVTAAVSNEGLPSGVQVIGRPFEDELVLAVAEAIEQVRGPWQAPSFDAA